MIVLGIESSCDETAAAVVRGGREVLSDVVASQIDRHRAFGGVVPEIACRAHAEAILPVVQRALADAKLGIRDIDGIAVTTTPGLVGALLVGVSFAKALALSLGRPIVGVDHLHAHLYATHMGCAGLAYPCVGFIVSGGHTDLYRSTSEIDHELLGTTQDDAAGEAFDKVAKILGLSFPGGPAIERAASECADGGEKFSKPDVAGFDFSFSGIKTGVLYRVRGQNARENRAPAPDEAKRIAKGFQEAVVGSLVDKAMAACAATGIRRLAVGGGVAANQRLREVAEARGTASGVEVFFPPIKYCTDNAAMVAGLGHRLFERGLADSLDLDATATKDYRSAR